MAKLLYFGRLPDHLGKASEEATLPSDISDVRGLLAWLRTRDETWRQHLAEEWVQVTVNKQFAEMESPVTDGDEIAIVSKSL
ncbi:MAG: MoaD/ThiS family protein [Gammaproteobacteria bacterium]|jgi:sulfur-carrier protein